MNQNKVPFIFPQKGKGKAGITVSLNQEENKEPFEVTVFFRNPESSPDNEAISITASGKLSLNIGKRGYLELFGENTQVIQDSQEKEEGDEMPAV